VAVVVALLALGVANIVTHARPPEVEDGVLWGSGPNGITAVDLAADSPAANAGIQRGDVLLAVNGAPVQNQADIAEIQRRGHEGTRLTYTLARLGTRQFIEVALVPAPQTGSMYYVLAGVGLFALLVGAAVRLRRPH